MANLSFDAEKHEYRADGVVVPSVHDIMDVINKAFKIPIKDLDDERKMRWWMNFWIKIKIKRDWGKVLHKYTEMYDLGTINPDRSKWDKRMIPMVDAWQRFKDEIVFKNRRTKIVEIKSIDEPNAITGVQLAGYLRAVTESALGKRISFSLLPDHWSSVCAIEQIVYSDSLRYAGRADRIYGGDFSNEDNIDLIACCLSPKGTYKTKFYNFKEYWNIFLCCMTIHNFLGK